MAQFIESDQGMINLAYVVRIEEPVNGYARVHLVPHAGKRVLRSGWNIEIIVAGMRFLHHN